MKCCADCIGDKQLVQILFADREINKCDFCKRNAPCLINPLVARDYFELLLEVYQQDPNGKNLAEALTQDWNLFPGQDTARIQAILAEILGDDIKVQGKWSAVNHGQENKLIRHWEEFRPALIHGNRFFPKAEIIPLFEALKESFGIAMAYSNELAPSLFRARICDSDIIFSIDQMGAPPAAKVGNGRANPNGIPYLYLASTAQTAISEIRPNPSDRVTLVEVQLAPKLKLVDLMHPRKHASPFMYADAKQIATLRVHLRFMERLSEELSKPVLPRTANLDYLPTQFVSEAIKHFGFDGIIFQSSVSNGFNVALFDPSKANFANPSLNLVTQVGFEFKVVEDN